MCSVMLCLQAVKVEARRCFRLWLDDFAHAGLVRLTEKPAAAAAVAEPVEPEAAAAAVAEPAVEPAERVEDEEPAPATVGVAGPSQESRLATLHVV